MLANPQYECRLADCIDPPDDALAGSQILIVIIGGSSPASPIRLGSKNSIAWSALIRLSNAITVFVSALSVRGEVSSHWFGAYDRECTDLGLDL